MIFSTAQLIGWILQYRYVILLPIAVLEGPIITVICGILAAAGQLDIWVVYPIVILGDLIGDVLWYYLGYRYGHRFIKKYGHRFGLTEEKVARVKARFNQHKHPILFFSKITNGFGLALLILFTAGMAKIPFRRYMLINLVGQFIWSGILLALGYLFSNALARAQNIETKILIFALVAAVLFFVVRYIRRLRSKIL